MTTIMYALQPASVLLARLTSCDAAPLFSGGGEQRTRREPQQQQQLQLQRQRDRRPLISRPQAAVAGGAGAASRAAQPDDGGATAACGERAASCTSDAPADAQAAAGLLALHDSVLGRLLGLLDARTKCRLAASCKRYHALFALPEHWRELVFDSATEQHGLAPSDLVQLLQRARGGCQVIQLARCEEARAAEREQRFACGFKCDQVLPHTRGLRAYALAALAPTLQRLTLDERASCVGGMTDDLARALAVHCKGLRVLQVYFQRYSLPSELFTDEGLIALSEGARGLRGLALHNCDHVTDRALYAVAANCQQLASLTLGGYSEHVTDGGVAVLFEACPALTHVRLSSKLLKVTDASGAALAGHCAGLQAAKLTRAMGDATLRALAAGCGQLGELDVRRCGRVGCDALAQLLRGCPQLTRLALPLALDAAPLLAALEGASRRFSVQQDEEGEQQLLLLHAQA